MSIAPAVTRTPIGTPDDALFELARIAAARKLLDARETAVKAVLRTRWATEAGWEHVAGDVGKALVTTPKKEPRVTEQQAFQAWYAARWPDRVKTLRRVDPSPIEMLLTAGGDDADLLADLLTDLGAIREDVLLPDKALAEVAKESKTVKGALVTKDDGEIVPGVEVSAVSQPTLRVTLDPEAVQDLLASLQESIPPIDEEHDAREA